MIAMRKYYHNNELRKYSQLEEGKIGNAIAKAHIGIGNISHRLTNPTVKESLRDRSTGSRFIEKVPEVLRKPTSLLIRAASKQLPEVKTLNTFAMGTEHNKKRKETDNFVRKLGYGLNVGSKFAAQVANPYN